MNIVETKDEDLVQAVDASDDEGDENFEFGYSCSTLRKSACYTLVQFSTIFQEETFHTLYPFLEQALASQLTIQSQQQVFHT